MSRCLRLVAQAVAAVAALWKPWVLPQLRHWQTQLGSTRRLWARPQFLPRCLCASVRVRTACASLQHLPAALACPPCWRSCWHR